MFGLPLAGAGRFYTRQPAANLTALNAADVSAYRWLALARFYTGQRATNLTTLSAADILAYRWQAWPSSVPGSWSRRI